MAVFLHPSSELPLRAAEARFKEELKEKEQLKARSPLKFQIGLAISIIFMLGSVFLLCSTHLIPVPTGSTPFNPLRAAIYVGGSGTLGGGILATLVFAAKWWNLNNDLKKSDALLDRAAFDALKEAIILVRGEEHG